ncbi:DUF2950 domain-containing protein [Arenimonas daejeonensis]|uniref:DUF2950 domain-containing protein n=1 Tax=Arenimonas daejeonensis TaxID=370777 RepID=UPI001D13C0F2|nr:DUF2950 domain-containing protein [Arenimonas daejeonensis]
MKTVIKPLGLTLALALALAALPAAAQQAFATPEEAAQALVQAVTPAEGDQAQLKALFGDQWRDYVPVGSVAREDVDAFLRRYAERRAFENPAPDRAVLSVGTEPWTLPIPLVKGKDGWSFDIEAGAEEARIRRIGRNELATVQSALAYHDAQMEYSERDLDGDGVLEYAQHLLSTDGLHDGLYWAEDDSGEISPLGPLFGDAEPGSDWHGYHYRILDAQGASAPGGAYSYKLGDNMSRGFALIAWPAQYNDSGVMSFMISHEGVVFEKDLGPDSDRLAAAITVFDPDSSWTEVPAAAEPAAP